MSNAMSGAVDDASAGSVPSGFRDESPRVFDSDAELDIDPVAAGRGALPTNALSIVGTTVWGRLSMVVGIAERRCRLYRRKGSRGRHE